MTNYSINVIKRALRSGDESGLEVLQQGLKESQYSPVDITLAGKYLSAFWKEKKNLEQLIFLGQCTTSWLLDAFIACAWKNGMAFTAEEGEYDTILQTLLEVKNFKYKYCVLVPWNQRLRFQHAKKNSLASEIINDEMLFWNHSWELTEKQNMRIIQIGYDYTGCGSLGVQAGSRYNGDIDLIRKMNETLREQLPSGAYFIDLEYISGQFGRNAFYDSRRYYWTKQPFSDIGNILLAEQIVNAVRVLKYGSKKVLVLDLDNTLWGGIVGDVGVNGIELGEGPDGEAFRDFQRFCKELSHRGILLAVASKNNEKDAKEPFKDNLNMVLKLDDIASFQANWKPKSENLNTIAKELNLGVDSLVFFDDNPAEREEVRQNASEVMVIDVPKEPWNYIRAIENSYCFETLVVTDADFVRTQQYQLESKRRNIENTFTNLDDYLYSLKMTANFDSITNGNMQRVIQLLGKTNQFNLTTKRHDEATIRRFLANPKTITVTVHLLDKFGDHGLIAVAILIPAIESQDKILARFAGNDGLIIDTLLMSCRVINRTVEEYLMNQLFCLAEKQNIQRLVSEYIPTQKNVITNDFFIKMGFNEQCRDPLRTVYMLDFPAKPLMTFVQSQNNL